MTNDHSVRSPSTDGGSTSSTVRAGMREAIKPFANLLRLYDSYESEFGKPTYIGVEISDIRKLVAALLLPEAGEPACDCAPWPDKCPYCGQPGPSEANSPAAPVDDRCDYCKKHGFQHPNLCEDCRHRGKPAPVDAGVREALEIGKELNEILNRYLASHDGDEPHYADVLREWLWDHKARIAAALSSQPVVSVDQEEAPLRRTDR